MIITYNIHSLMDFDDRLAFVIEELGSQDWDLIIFTETWRGESREVSRTDGGHTWFGSGGTCRASGVGMLLNRRWDFESFSAVSDRVCSLDIQVSNYTLRAIGVYMPHCGYNDIHVESVYASVEPLLTNNEGRCIRTIIAGDFNAQVGITDADTDEVKDQNARGLWLRNWCDTHGYSIANSQPGVHFDNLWTFKNGRLLKQLDYILLDSVLARQLTSCRVMTDFSTGSDHRAVLGSLVLPGQIRPKRIVRGNGSAACNRKINISTYQQLISDKLHSHSPGCRDITSKMTSLQTNMVDCFSKSGIVPLQNIQDPSVTVINAEIRQFISLRRRCGPNDTTTKASICKNISRLIRKRSRLQKHSSIKRIMTEFRGLRDIASFSCGQKHNIISCIKSRDGVEVTSKPLIVEVFASFYEKLYHSSRAVTSLEGLNSTSTIPPFSIEEFICALGKLKSGKASDASGVISEMIRHAGGPLHMAVLDLFNDILDPQALPPQSWKQTRLKVIFKKGDPLEVKNYRPIASIPILYKLFSRMVCGRIQSKIFSNLSPAQAAYRPSFSTDDHLLSVALLVESCKEWNQELWIALVDFEKAFDMIEHDSLFDVLRQLGIEDSYVHLVQKLYRDQVASVHVNMDSRSFPYLRGVKQGDPISGLLFVSVLEICFRNLDKIWKTANRRRRGQYFGMVVDEPDDPLLSLRFADDVALVAQSQSDVTKMLGHLRLEALKYGLVMNMDKTKVLTTAGAGAARVKLGDAYVNVLNPDQSEKYLGRKLNLQNQAQVELTNRLQSAWATFTKYKEVFRSRWCTFSLKMKMFDALVTPVVLYGAGSWTLTKEMETQLQTTRRRMLRDMLGARRQAGETWVEHIKRTTEIAEEKSKALGYDTWTVGFRKKKWRLAGKVAQSTGQRWSKRLLDWRPFFRCHPYRDVGHPCARWSDMFVAIAGGSWTTAACDASLWSILEPACL